MNLLSIETSCEQGSIALFSDGKTVNRQLSGYTSHSEHILQEIGVLLDRQGISLKQLDAIAFGCGPGAFTGLRLACGVAQGLALGAGIKVIPVSSLAALATQARGDCVVAGMDARMGQIYYGCFRKNGSSVLPESETFCVVPENMSLPEGEWCGIGSAFAAYPGLGDRFLLSGVQPDAVPRAEEILQLAISYAERGEMVSPEAAALTYVRDKVAYTTRERLARGGKA